MGSSANTRRTGTAWSLASQLHFGSGASDIMGDACRTHPRADLLGRHGSDVRAWDEPAPAPRRGPPRAAAG
jgi:hypothetical protein